MGLYRWEGFNTAKKKVSGEMEAGSVREVKKTLRRQGIRVRKIKEPSIGDLDLGKLMVEKGLMSAFSRDELGRFTMQMSTLLNAGVPILETIELLAKQNKNPNMKSILLKIHEEVADGKALAEALEGKQGFDKLYVNLVKAGEAGGILDTILVKLGEHMDKQSKIKKQIKGALSYPIIIAVVGIGVVIGLMVFVVPQFVGMLKDSGQEVPWVTQVVIDTSNFMQNYFLHIIIGLFFSVVSILYYRGTEKGKLNMDKWVMKAPMFGDLVIKGNLAQFTRTLATMLGAGVSILDSLDICIDTLDNSIIARDLTKVKDSVATGKTIVEPLQRIRYFPDLVQQMIKVGEATGNLDNMLVKVADVFEEEVEEVIGGITKMIEPIILVGLGGIIGFVMIAMYLPMFMAGGSA
jgi:type IV pilus assembly protein PilC